MDFLLKTILNILELTNNNNMIQSNKLSLYTRTSRSLPFTIAIVPDTQQNSTSSTTHHCLFKFQRKSKIETITILNQSELEDLSKEAREINYLEVITVQTLEQWTRQLGMGKNLCFLVCVMSAGVIKYNFMSAFLQFLPFFVECQRD